MVRRTVRAFILLTLWSEGKYRCPDDNIDENYRENDKDGEQVRTSVACRSIGRTDYMYRGTETLAEPSVKSIDHYTTENTP